MREKTELPYPPWPVPMACRALETPSCRHSCLWICLVFFFFSKPNNMVEFGVQSEMLDAEEQAAL